MATSFLIACLDSLSGSEGMLWIDRRNNTELRISLCLVELTSIHIEGFLVVSFDAGHAGLS